MYTNFFQALLTALGYHVVLYVDDTNVIITGETISQLKLAAEKLLELFTEVYSSINLEINWKKTMFMIFHPDKDSFDKISVNNNVICAVRNVNFLGIIIDDQLTWRPNIVNVVAKLNKGIFVLSQTNQILHEKQNMAVYNAFINSALCYGTYIWAYDLNNKIYLGDLFKLQKKALRILLHGSPKAVSCRGEFRKSNLLTLTSIFILQASLYARKTLETNQELHHYNTRSKNQIHRVNCTASAPNSYAALIYNKIPAELRKCQGDAFKKELKKWLIEKEFYSLDGFNTSN